MKKVVKVIGLMSMAALFAISVSSCKKTEENAEFTVNLGQMHENPSERAYLDFNGQFLWSEGDQIMVYNLASTGTGGSIGRVFTALPGADDQPTTKFKGRPVGARKDKGFRFFYPASKAGLYPNGGNLDSDNRETFTVDDRQFYSLKALADPTALVLACELDRINQDVTMQHIFGILNFRIKTTRTDLPRVKEIKVVDNAFNLHGDLSLKLSEITILDFETLLAKLQNGDDDYAEELGKYLQSIGYYEANHGAGKDMTLDCSRVNDGNAQNLNGVLVPRTDNIADAQRFRMILRPGALYRGFTYTIKFMDSSIPDIVQEVPASMDYLIKPSYFTPIDVTVN